MIPQLLKDRSRVRNAALSAGCGYLDFAYLIHDFDGLSGQPRPPDQIDGINSGEERCVLLVFWGLLFWLNFGRYSNPKSIGLASVLQCFR